MSTFRHPVGPEPTPVYWRRRLVVLLGLIAVVVVALLLVGQLGAGGDERAASSPSDEPAASEPAADATEEEPAADSSAPPVDGAACDPAAVRVEALTDTNAYAAGQLPQLSFRITNTSGDACTFNLGSTQQSFVVTSGEEPYWASADCLTDPVDAAVLLEPNVAQTSTPIPWDRTRSSSDTCDTERTPVPAGGATYNLTVTVGTAEPSTTSFLLN